MPQELGQDALNPESQEKKLPLYSLNPILDLRTLPHSTLDKETFLLKGGHTPTGSGDITDRSQESGCINSTDTMGYEEVLGIPTIQQTLFKHAGCLVV